MKTLKKIKSAASATMTIASFLVMVIAFCTVDINELSWTPFIAFFAAFAWLWYAINKVSKGGEQE